LVIDLLSFGNDKTVVSVLSFINHAGVLCLLILKYEELVTQKVHLKDSLLNRHRLEGEGLCSYLEFGLVVDIIVGCVARVENSFSESLFKSSFVSADLAFDGVDGAVEGVLEGLVLGFATEQGVCRVDRNFKINVVALTAEGYCGIALVIEVFVQL